MQTNKSIGMEIAELREEKRLIDARLEALTEKAKTAVEAGEDVSCADYLVTVKPMSKTSVKADMVRELQAFIPPLLYGLLWRTSQFHSVYVKPRR